MPSKINYQNKLDAILESLPTRFDRTPRLFLHACCAPCSSYTLEYLSQYFSITVYYYNPNIMPKEEYLRRRDELYRLVREMPLPNPVRVIAPETYDVAHFRELIRGLEKEPERGARCQVCIAHRLKKTYEMAAIQEEKPDYVGTTLSISPHKDADYINNCGERIATGYDIPWLYADLKKRGGYQRSLVLSHEYGLYRQSYCGCDYGREMQQTSREDKQFSPINN